MSGHVGGPGRRLRGLRPARRTPAGGPGHGRPPALDADTLARADALLPEAGRWCPSCDGPVGRGRGGRPGRLRGTCASCRRPYDLTPDLAPGAVLAGTRGGRFVVTGLLARGGSAWVHTARDAVDGRRVVVSRREDGDAATPATLLGRGHPALVGLRDVVVEQPAVEQQEPAVVRLVTDLVEGAPPRPPLAPDAAAALVLAVLPACAHLHRLGLLHADLKPGNLLITPDGPVLADLGSVRRVDDRTGPVWGTAGFLAPEIAPGGAGPSVASEIHALGRTLDVLLGRPVLGHLARRCGPGPAVTPLDPVVRRATALDPAARHRDLDALGEDLRARLGAPGRTTRPGHPARSGVAGTGAGGGVHQDGGTSAVVRDGSSVPEPVCHPRGALPT